MNDAADQVASLGAPYKLPCGLVSPNRLCKAAMEEMLGPLGGGPPMPEHFKLYRDWAQGNWGLILTGNVMISPTNLGSPRDIVIPAAAVDTEEYKISLAAFSAWSTASHSPFLDDPSKSPLVVMQLCHPGRQSTRGSGRALNKASKCPSAIALNSNKGFFEKLVGQIMWGTPDAMTQEDIDEVVGGFVKGAKLARESGFDGVQLHCSHGYLLAQFLSPNVNVRTDSYGGSALARMKIVFEIIDAIRKELPLSSGFALGIKLNSSDYVQGGLTEKDALDNVKWLAEHGGVDFIEISGGTYENAEMLKDDHEQTAARSSKKMNTTSENLEPTSNTFSREAFFISFASSARSLLASLPPAASPSPAIMVTGGFRTRTGMAQALSSSSTDFVGVGRPACVDPALPIKLLDAKLSAGEARSPIYSVKGAELLRLIPLGVVMAGAGTIWHTMVLAIVARGEKVDLDMTMAQGVWRVWLRDAVKRNMMYFLMLFGFVTALGKQRFWDEKKAV